MKLDPALADLHHRAMEHSNASITTVFFFKCIVVNQCGFLGDLFLLKLSQDCRLL